MSSRDLSCLLRPQPPVWYSRRIQKSPTLCSRDKGCNETLDGYITLEEITITLAIYSLLCLKAVIVDFTGVPASSIHWLKCYLQSFLIQFTPSIQMETVFVRSLDTTTVISLCGINISWLALGSLPQINRAFIQMELLSLRKVLIKYIHNQRVRVDCVNIYQKNGQFFDRSTKENDIWHK